MESILNKLQIKPCNGKTRNGRGYILIRNIEHPYHNATGYVMEHRLKMEQHIGRYLKRQEVVHHINGIKDDNRIENLQLLKNQSIHIKNNCPWRNKIKKYCIHGHKKEGENLHILTKGKSKGYGVCIACRNINLRKWRKKQKEIKCVEIVIPQE